MATLIAKNLAKAYKGRRVVEDVSLTVNSGEIVGLLGPNGAGKSTLIKALLNLVKESDGEIIYHIDKKFLGYLPQITETSHKMFPASVFEVISTGLLLKKSFPKLITKAVMYLYIEDKKALCFRIAPE